MSSGPLSNLHQMDRPRWPALEDRAAVDIDLTATPPGLADRLAPSSPVHSSEIAIRHLPTKNLV